MTEGRGRVTDPPTTGAPPSATTDALPASTSTRARSKDTTARGSYPALSTRVRIPHPLPPDAHLAGGVSTRTADGPVLRSSGGRRKAPFREWNDAFPGTQRFVAAPHRPVRRPHF